MNAATTIDTGQNKGEGLALLIINDSAYLSILL